MEKLTSEQKVRLTVEQVVRSRIVSQALESTRITLAALGRISRESVMLAYRPIGDYGRSIRCIERALRLDRAKQ